MGDLFSKQQKSGTKEIKRIWEDDAVTLVGERNTLAANIVPYRDYQLDNLRLPGTAITRNTLEINVTNLPEEDGHNAKSNRILPLSLVHGLSPNSPGTCPRPVYQDFAIQTTS